MDSTCPRDSSLLSQVYLLCWKEKEGNSFVSVRTHGKGMAFSLASGLMVYVNSGWHRWEVSEWWEWCVCVCLVGKTFERATYCKLEFPLPQTYLSASHVKSWIRHVLVLVLCTPLCSLPIFIPVSAHFYLLPQGVCLGFFAPTSCPFTTWISTILHSLVEWACWLLTCSCSFKKCSAGKGEVTFMRPLCIL